MRLPCLVIFTKQYLQTDVFATSSYSLRQLIVLIFFTTYKDKLKYKVILVLKHWVTKTYGSGGVASRPSRFTPGEIPPPRYSLNRRLSVSQSWCGRDDEEDYVPLSGYEPRSQLYGAESFLKS